MRHVLLVGVIALLPSLILGSLRLIERAGAEEFGVVEWIALSMQLLFAVGAWVMLRLWWKMRRKE